MVNSPVCRAGRFIYYEQESVALCDFRGMSGRAIAMDKEGCYNSIDCGLSTGAFQ